MQAATMVIVGALLSGLPCVTLSAATTAMGGAAEIRVTDIKTEHLSEPLGIVTPKPRFGWLLESGKRQQLQTAYQILVASSIEKLHEGTSDKWNSGKIRSDNSVEVQYQGTELKSGERVYWKVRIWDRNGRPSAFSTPSFFEMGLRRADDWQGQWIATKRRQSGPLFRREVRLPGAIRSARVHVSGVGYYELSINGTKIGDRVLTPASTTYHNSTPFKLNSRVLYTTYDVTSSLQAGANVIGMILGNGWYSAEPEKTDAIFRREPYGDRPRLILQMNIELTDGRTVNVVSDPSWKTTQGPILYDDLANGETYDARLEQAGWDAPGFDDAAWDHAVPVEPPGGVLTPELLPPIRVVQTLPVVERITPKEPILFEEAQIYDFGQNFSGWARIKVSGPRGAKLVLRYASRIHPEDSTLDNRSNTPEVWEARQTDTYILKGGGTEVWEPRFTLHGFRYVEIRNVTKVRDPTATVDIQSVEGRFVRSAVESVGAFTCSNDLLNRIHRNIQWTLMTSFQGIPQDASERGERVPALGDPGFVAEDYIYNYDVSTFWEKWLDDIRDSQNESGSVPIVSPLHLGSVNAENIVWPSWQSTYPLLMWYLYEYYGNRGVLERHYEGLKKLVSFHNVAAKDGLIETEPVGDHMEPQLDGFSSSSSRHTSPALTANAYYYATVIIAAKTAAAIGRPDEARAYEKRAQRIKVAFNIRFFNSTTNQYDNGSQTSNALPLYLGLVPEDRVPKVMANLVADIREHETHVSTGIVGSNALVQVLSKYGAAPLMYELANQTSYPSLGDQVRRGATTVCESYECGPWVSQNMKMFASLDKFFYRELAGIRPTAVGYRRVLIQPQPVGDLTSVNASHRTARGLVTVEWSRHENAFRMDVSIPAGMEAEIAVPTLGRNDFEITESGLTVWRLNSPVRRVPGLKVAKAEPNAVHFYVGSGSYTFRLL